MRLFPVLLNHFQDILPPRNAPALHEVLRIVLHGHICRKIALAAYHCLQFRRLHLCGCHKLCQLGCDAVQNVLGLDIFGGLRGLWQLPVCGNQQLRFRQILFRGQSGSLCLFYDLLCFRNRCGSWCSEDGRNGRIFQGQHFRQPEPVFRIPPRRFRGVHHTVAGSRLVLFALVVGGDDVGLERQKQGDV